MNKRKKSKIGVLIFLAIFSYFAYIIYKQEGILNKQRIEMASIQQNVEQQNKINEGLKKQKDELSTNENYEKIARDRLGMVKDGDKVFVDVNK
jgi:cell division protein FtsL